MRNAPNATESCCRRRPGLLREERDFGSGRVQIDVPLLEGAALVLYSFPRAGTTTGVARFRLETFLTEFETYVVAWAVGAWRGGRGPPGAIAAVFAYGLFRGAGNLRDSLEIPSRFPPDTAYQSV